MILSQASPNQTAMLMEEERLKIQKRRSQELSVMAEMDENIIPLLYEIAVNISNSIQINFKL